MGKQMKSYLNELDAAALKVQMRQMYKKIGYQGSLWRLGEMVQSSQILLKVIMEEHGEKS